MKKLQELCMYIFLILIVYPCRPETDKTNSLHDEVDELEQILRYLILLK